MDFPTRNTTPPNEGGAQLDFDDDVITPKAQSFPVSDLDSSLATNATPPPTRSIPISTPNHTNRTSVLSQLPDLKTQTTVAHERAQELGRSQSYHSPSMLAQRAPGIERSYSERSPSPHTRRAPNGALSEAMNSTKSPGLIRRVSRGAANRIRRRASTTTTMRMRDQSAGPVLVRRRSDSNGASDLAQDVSDLDLDSLPDEAGEEPEYTTHIGRTNGLGISMGRTSNVSNGSTSFEGGIAPAISAVLEQGTWVVKVTSKKQKKIKLWLDTNSARVCWHPSSNSKSFFIDDVREIRIGADSRNARDDVQLPDEHEDRWVTIVYDVPERFKGRAIKTMHILCPDVFITKLWSDALNVVTRERIEIMNALAPSVEKSEKSMAMAWRQAMARKGPDAEQSFTLEDARWLCRKLEINCSANTVKTHFTRSDTDHTGLLDYTRYRDFVNSFKERKDIQNLFRNTQYGTELDMSIETFFQFLKVDQGTDVDKDRAYWEGVFAKFAKETQPRSLADTEPTTGERKMNMQGFQNFMASGAYTAPLTPLKGEPTLERPLNEYFISSSHNTYLLGRQVGGRSSVEGYIAALVKGCRCIEIDCWDGENDRPMVTHGRSLTTRVPFADCVAVINRYAFHSTPYPLIVSLEVHCCDKQQLVMVELMKKHFGDKMITEPLVSNSVSLPSPEELRHKILIKVKASSDLIPSQPPAAVENSNGRSRARSIGSAFTRTPSIETAAYTSSPLVSSPSATSPSEQGTGLASTPRGSTASGPTATPSTSTDDSDDMPASAEKMKKKKTTTSKIKPELGRLGVYTQGVTFTDFDQPEARWYNHIYSFNEGTFSRASRKSHETKELLEKHNLRYLMRVYPASKRVDSSNFNPLAVWRRGAQMAALNWQTYDVHMQVNEAMFAAGSDKLGYVLKPEELRRAKHLPITDTLADAAERRDKKDKKLVKFSVEILSAQRLPRPRNANADAGMNPYIEFEMYSAEDKARGIAKGEGGTDASARDGSSGIGSPLRKRTRVVEGNGFDPSYYQNIDMSVETRYPSLIFVRWTVWNSPDAKKNSGNNTLLATFTAKLSSLQQGYRHLPLFNPHGEQYRDAKLFVRISKEAPVPIERDETAYGIIEPSSSPRPESTRIGRSYGWPRKFFSRNNSRRRDLDAAEGSTFSRTSSMERDGSVG
ncbi:hypothetical protein MBLNU230_g7098t1 [Neophaeotheca triangularis]